MLDIGWSEMAIIAVIALFVIGPRELPKVLRTLGRYAGKIKAVAREFQSSIDEAVRESELGEVKKQIEAAGRTDFTKKISDTVDPDNKIGKAMDFTEITRANKKPELPKADDASGAGDDAPAAKPSNGAGPAKTGSGEETAAAPDKASAPAEPEVQAKPAAADADKAGA